MYKLQKKTKSKLTPFEIHLKATSLNRGYGGYGVENTYLEVS